MFFFSFDDWQQLFVNAHLQQANAHLFCNGRQSLLMSVDGNYDLPHCVVILHEFMSQTDLIEVKHLRNHGL